MIDLFLYYWWIPLIYLGIGFVLIGGSFFPIWNRYVDKFDQKELSDKGYYRLNQGCKLSGIVLLGVCWYIIVMRNVYGMHPFIFATFMLQPLGQALFIFGYFMENRRLRFGTLGVHFLIILYACLGMIVIHDIFWCARRTDWYTHSHKAGEDLILYAVLLNAPYNYLIFGEVMVLQLILLVGAAIALLYVLEKRLKQNPDDFTIQKLFSDDKPIRNSNHKSKFFQFIIPLLIFFVALFGFAVAVDIIDDIRFYGGIQYTLAVHFYLPFFCALAMLGFFLFKRESYYKSPWLRFCYVFIYLMLINMVVSLIASIQLSYILKYPRMPKLYKATTSLFNLPYTYLSMTLIFGILSILMGILLYVLYRHRFKDK